VANESYSARTFTEKENSDCREVFIKECKQKAWGAACHADFISKRLDGAMAEYQKLEAQSTQLGEESNWLEAAPDHYTAENRNKRKAIQTRRDGLNKTMGPISANVQQTNRAVAELHRNIESNLALQAVAAGSQGGHHCRLGARGSPPGRGCGPDGAGRAARD
jgi:hypothetical protein